MRSMLVGLFLTLASAQAASECETLLPEIANRFANDYNGYNKRYHVETISATRSPAQTKQRKRTIEEFEAVKRCDCW